MRPLGYLYKQVHPRPDWLQADEVKDLCSVSGCISHDFADYIDAWKHNGFWLFDQPSIMADIAEGWGISLAEMTLFYYEGYEKEYDEEDFSWVDYEPEASFPLAVVPPKEKSLLGYDLVSFSMGNSPECSPLSCNGLAAELPVNEHCLLDSLEEAKEILEKGLLRKAEPGPYRVIAVYLVEYGG
ncbi:MAG: hypothetical protein H6728_07325 [Myxococcales bacterium]|nr:hypothetical protein [Myxococcales bacterium]MCB9642872.1 hypothetical protein [Myxococcales bacterium]